MKGFENLKEIEEACKKGVASDITLVVKCMPFICKSLVEISGKLEGKKGKANAWNKFVGEYLRQGKTMQEAARDYKAKKGQ